MARDYKKEMEKRNEKSIEIRAFIKKELGLALKEKLKAENKSIASWITENAEIFLQNM